MKLKKKTAMLLSFAVGTVMFATTAMAEVTSKTGYDQLKDALKYTAENCTEKLSSYTANATFALKDNDVVVSSENMTAKYDVKNNSQERVTTSVNENKKTEGYSYSDSSVSITHNDSQDIYYVNEFASPTTNRSAKNPFKEKQAGDIEKIADALVGNLKDYVVVAQNPDGSKELSGSLNESQIPALVNAVVSFQFKNTFGGYRAARLGVGENTALRLTDDITVKEVKGQAVVNKDGLIQNVLGTGVISGKDDQGKEHNLTFELLVKLNNINSTVVNKPDLTGKKTEKAVVRNYDQISNPEMYAGIYKSDIVMEKDGKLIKIGERIVNIAHIDDKNIAGNYHEEYRKGYESYAKIKEFNFDAKMEGSHTNANFDYTTTVGKVLKANIFIDVHSSRLYFNLPEPQDGKLMFDGSFNRVFE